MGSFKALAAGLACALSLFFAATGAASADVIYNFTMTSLKIIGFGSDGQTSPNTPFVAGTMTVTDDAYWSGVIPWSAVERWQFGPYIGGLDFLPSCILQDCLPPQFSMGTDGLLLNGSEDHIGDTNDMEASGQGFDWSGVFATDGALDICQFA